MTKHVSPKEKIKNNVVAAAGKQRANNTFKLVGTQSLHGSGNSLQNLANNSRQVSQLKQYQTVANNGAGVAQLQSYQNMADKGMHTDAIIQLKKLDTVKLNVVGENHPESNKRRDSEEAIAKKYTGGGYWQEGEFKIGPDTRSTLAWIFTSDKRERGDSSELLVEQNAAIFARGCGIWANKVSRYSELTSLEKNQMIAALPAFDRFATDVKVHNDRILDAKKKKTVLLGTVNALHTMVKAIVAGNASTVAAGFAGAIASVEHALGGKTKETISTARSEHMHASANTSNNTKGVWKVGQKHITDIGAKPAEAFQYALMTENEFDTEYAAELKPD